MLLDKLSTESSEPAGLEQNRWKNGSERKHEEYWTISKQILTA